MIFIKLKYLFQVIENDADETENSNDGTDDSNDGTDNSNDGTDDSNDGNTEDCNLSNEYTFASKSWGDFYYKFYESPRYYADALAKCESDGAFLAYPRSQAENDFILSFVTSNDNLDLWIGINDVDEEGTIVTTDGQDIVFTKWWNPLPSNHNNQDAAMMYAANWGSMRGHWVMKEATGVYGFVCFKETSPNAADLGKFSSLLSINRKRKYK